MRGSLACSAIISRLGIEWSTRHQDLLSGPATSRHQSHNSAANAASGSSPAHPASRRFAAPGSARLRWARSESTDERRAPRRRPSGSGPAAPAGGSSGTPEIVHETRRGAQTEAQSRAAARPRDAGRRRACRRTRRRAAGVSEPRSASTVAARRRAYCAQRRATSLTFAGGVRLDPPLREASRSGGGVELPDDVTDHGVGVAGPDGRRAGAPPAFRIEARARSVSLVKTPG